MNKKLRVLLLSLFGVVVIGAAVYAANTDLWNASGSGPNIFNNKDVARVDKDGNLRIYTGSIILGDKGTTPSKTKITTTSGGSVSVLPGYMNIRIPVTFQAAATEGDVECSSITATAVGSVTPCVNTATTTVIGVADGTYAAGSVGWVVIDGYALVHSSGTVQIGDILVSSAPITGAKGYAGTTTGTQVVGTGIGVALTKGAAAGDTVLALINKM